MLKKVLIGLAALIVLLILVAYLLPSHIHVERSAVIDASPEKVYSDLNNFRNWSAWSPWQKLDPNMQHSYSGPESGVGHKDTWTSDHKYVGNGSQTIVESVPNELIKSQLEFDGQEGGSGFFKLESEGEGTKVTWGMDMEAGMNPMSRYMGLMMEGWMGPVFEQGLGDLKAHVESLPDPEPEMEAMPMEEGAASDSTMVETETSES